MDMVWRRPSGTSIVALCIEVDNNIDKIVVPELYPELENKIYNDIWLIVRSLSQKKNYFQNYADYDQFAFFAATRLYFALLKSRRNAGKVIHNHVISPIRSILNYTKVLLYPRKVEYQNKNFRQASIGGEADPASGYEGKMFQEAKHPYNATESLKFCLNSSLSPRSLNYGLTHVLKRCHYKAGTKEYKYLKYSVLLTALSSIRTRNKLALPDEPTRIKAVVSWLGNKEIINIIEIYVRAFYDWLKKEINDCCTSAELPDEEAEMVLKNQFIEARGGYANDEH